VPLWWYSLSTFFHSAAVIKGLSAWNRYVVMAKLIQPPQKFVPSEWIYGCRYLYGNTEAERAAAERLVMESQRTMEDTNKTTQRLVFENKKRTGEHYIYW